MLASRPAVAAGVAHLVGLEEPGPVSTLVDEFLFGTNATGESSSDAS
jgi:hypothetical protein